MDPVRSYRVALAKKSARSQQCNFDIKKLQLDLEHDDGLEFLEYKSKNSLNSSLTENATGLAITSCIATVRRLRDHLVKIHAHHPMLQRLQNDNSRRELLYVVTALYNDKLRIRLLLCHGIDAAFLRSTNFDFDKIEERLSLPACKELGRTDEIDVRKSRAARTTPIDGNKAEIPADEEE
jgi:hypothetical protein